MKASETGVGYGEMELISPYNVQTLHDIQIIQTVNNHAKLYVTGMIPEEKKDSCLSMAKSGDLIELNQIKDGTVVRPLFKGIVSKLSIRVVRAIYYIELEAISHTFQLDIKQKSRSFQHHAMPYKELVGNILADYPGADAIDHASQSTKLGKFIVQYKETDWQFLRRMASHFGAVLVPNATADSPKFHFGLPEGRKLDLTSDFYSTAKDIESYRGTTENGYAPQLQESDFLTYVVESNQCGNVGDRVTINGKEFVVAQVKATMQQGILTYEYGLAIEAGIRQNLVHASEVKGSAIKGSVIDVKKDQVRLHLEMDEAQNKNEATWFPYSTLHTAEGNSGIYWMPELGDRVQLYFPSQQEEKAVATNSIRQGGATNPKTADPNTKYWGTNHGKEMKMGPSEVVFTAKEGSIYLKLDAEAGIEIKSSQPIHIQAEKDLELSSETIQFKAGESIRMTCDSSSIVMDGITDIQGNVVKMEGWTKGSVQVNGAEDDEDDDAFLQLGLDVAGMIPVAGGW